MKWRIAVLTCVVMGAGCGGGNESGRGIAFDSASGNDEGAGGELDDEGAEDEGTGDGRIAFRSKVFTDFEIFVMNADGTDVYSTGAHGDSPSWGG